MYIKEDKKEKNAREKYFSRIPFNSLLIAHKFMNIYETHHSVI